MAERQLELEGLAIVVLGSFNPAIFHPLWFSRFNLIRDEEAKNAKIDVVHPEVTQIAIDWFSMQVTQGRFQLETNDPTKSQPLRDVALGTFKILEHTPIKAFGLNREHHFRMLSEEDWHNFGHFYAPKAPWSGVLEQPGLRTLSMEGKRAGNDKNTVRVKVQPSGKAQPGVFVHVHEHHGLEESETSGQGSTEAFQREFQAAWAGFMSYADSVASRLFTNFDQKRGEKT